MLSVENELDEITRTKQNLIARECALKQQRRIEIGWLADQCGILNLSNDELLEAFKTLAINHYYKKVQHV